MWVGLVQFGFTAQGALNSAVFLEGSPFGVKGNFKGHPKLISEFECTYFETKIGASILDGVKQERPMRALSSKHPTKLTPIRGYF